jgi:pyridoxal phosphate enzyme (YggS family)
MQATTERDVTDADGLEERIARIRDQIAAAASRSGRPVDGISIVAVCKTVGREHVDAAFAAGLRHFGENRVQEAAAKFATPLPGSATLHLIGQLQTNKAKAASRLFGLIESVDRSGLVEALERAAASDGREMPVLVQVNVAGEEQKAGCAPEQAERLIASIRATAFLRLRGLMTIAPLVQDPEEVRPVFRRLRVLRDDLQRRDPSLDLPILSMGMSNDFAVAIEEGATHVRIGRAIFGDRS